MWRHQAFQCEDRQKASTTDPLCWKWQTGGGTGKPYTGPEPEAKKLREEKAVWWDEDEPGTKGPRKGPNGQKEESEKELSIQLTDGGEG